MGSGMAGNLHNAGHLHRVWNRTASTARAFAEATGIEAADSIAALASDCNLIVTCVSRDEDVLEVVSAIAAAAKPDTAVVDTSTVSRETALAAESILAGGNIRFLDGPVSGGVEGARNGSLSMMVGGDEATLEDLRDVLSSMATSIVHVGPTGSGQACKAVNQVMCAGINQAVTEALAFGEAMQLNMDRVLEVVTKGAAGNWFLDHRGHTMLAGDYDVGFKVNLHHKDLGICLDMARQHPAVDMALTDRTRGEYETLMQQGFGDEDISSLYRLKRRT